MRNMLGVISNLSEFDELRPSLMTADTLNIIASVLDYNKENVVLNIIEPYTFGESYSAAGIFANLASKGPNFWTVKSPSRDEILSRMTASMKVWSLDEDKYIDYVSFEPLHGLIKCNETACQMWAAWTIANLTKVSK